MPVLRYFSSIAQQTTLSGSISSGATSITVGATTGFPTSFPYTLALDYGAATEELVDVTAAAGTNLTVTRGVDGTSAQSHSLGAVVRHVASGRDFSDYQTHQAASSGVHGVTGSVVGTSDTQTLANKTLTSPTLNTPTTTTPTITGGGSLAGTFTGTPTFSGAVVFSGTPAIQGAALSGTFTGAPTMSGNVAFTGTPVFSGAPAFTGAAASNTSLSASVTGDTFDRFRIYADGKHEWGSGSGARDTVLYRGSADTLKSDDSLYLAPTSNSNTALRIDEGASFTGNVLEYFQNGVSRVHVDQDGNLTVRNIYTGPYDSYTPTWTSSGTAPSLGNGSLTGRFALIGKICHFYIVLAFGSTTTAGTGNYSFALPVTSSSVEVQVVNGQAATTSRGPVTGVIAQSATTIQFWGFTSTSSSGQGQIGGSGLYGVAWANGHFVRLSGTYETA